FRDGAVDRVLRGIYDSTTTLSKMPAADRQTRLSTVVSSQTPARRATYGQEIVDKAGALLDDITAIRLRGLGEGPHPRELREVIDLLGSNDKVIWLSWSVFYVDQLAAGLSQADYGILLGLLPDLFDPALPVARRTALFDALNRLDAPIRALREVVEVRG